MQATAKASKLLSWISWLECIAQGSGPPSMHYISVLEMDKSRGDVMPLASVIEGLNQLAGPQ